MFSLQEFCLCLINRKMMSTAIKVAMVIGTLLFIINHGVALLNGQMNRTRWISASFTYCIPYIVNIHGQYISSLKYRRNARY